MNSGLGNAWLLAYTHMLSGIGNLFMAFDPEPVLRDLTEQRIALKDAPEIPNYYDAEAVLAEVAAMEAESEALDSELAGVNNRSSLNGEAISILRSRLESADDASLKAAIQAEVGQKRQESALLQTDRRQLRQAARLVRNEIEAAQSKLAPGTSDIQQMLQQQQPAIDTLYVAIKALAQEPDAARIRAVHTHFGAMIVYNRVFWDRLTDETDNDREWIPNPMQEAVLPLTIPPRLATGWQNILLDIEAVLDGKLLIPHPGLPPGYGISLPAYVAGPGPLDLIGWLHGIGAYRYAARGPLVTMQNWRTFQRLSFGNAGGFALLFN